MDLSSTVSRCSRPLAFIVPGDRSHPLWCNAGLMQTVESVRSLGPGPRENLPLRDDAAHGRFGDSLLPNQSGSWTRGGGEFMSPEELEPKEGISRRKMIKRIGAGAAVAWTAPILTSIKTPAFAAYGVCTGNDNCGCSIPCNVAIPCNGTCNCWVSSPDNGGQCKCLFFVQFCGQFADCPGGQGDCDRLAPGTCCVQTCCGNTCTPKSCSGSGFTPRKTGGARTTR